MKFRAISHLILSSTISLTTLSVAAQPGEIGHTSKGNPMGRMMRQLSLTEEQMTIFYTSLSAGQDQRKTLRELREQLGSLVHSDDYSERQANVITRKISDIEQSIALQQANARHTFYIALSPEQQEKLKALKARRPHGDHGGRKGKGESE
ncbi:Spy/CpxP family protein refolding chaperone [Aurantivibrio plasticivorans]